MYHRECPVGIIFELLYSHTASETASPREPARVIEKIGMSSEVGHTAMVGKRPCVMERHYLAHILPRPFGRVTHRIGYMFGHTSGRIEQIIFAATLIEPRPLGIHVFVFGILVTEFDRRGSEALHRLLDFSDLALKRNHIPVELHIINFRITPVEISLSVIVDKDRRVDIVPTAVDKRRAYGILKRSDRRVTYSHSDSHRPGKTGVERHIEIKLAIALHTLRCPGPVVSPLEILYRQGRAVVGPVDHIL